MTLPRMVTEYPGKYCPRSPSVGPTTGPPVSTSASVATNSPMPPTTPTARPSATRSTLRNTRASSCSTSTSMSRSSLGGRDIDFFMVLLVGVNIPKVMRLAEDHAAHCKHARQHCVVLIIVAVRTIATNYPHVLKAVDELAHDGKGLSIV